MMTLKTKNSVFTDFTHYKTVGKSDFYHATKTTTFKKHKDEYVERVSVELVNNKIVSWQS
jgi:hypothetical protein